MYESRDERILRFKNNLLYNFLFLLSFDASRQNCIFGANVIDVGAPA